jgi:hypothetical protein
MPSHTKCCIYAHDVRILCVGLPHLKADSMSLKGILLRVMAGPYFFNGWLANHKTSFVHACQINLFAVVKGRFRV